MSNIKLRFLQLKPDLFADPRIRKLKTPTNGYIMLVIYLRLLTLALQDNGYIIYDTHFGTIIEQLTYAMVDETEADIEATIAYCVALGLIQIIDKESQLYFPAFAGMTNNIKSSGEIPTKNKKQLSMTPSAIRQRRYRKNLKIKKLEEKNNEGT